MSPQPMLLLSTILLPMPVLGIRLEQLRRASIAIAVIAGPAKHEIARAVVRSALATVLITDEDTARALLAPPGAGLNSELAIGRTRVR